MEEQIMITCGIK